MSWSPVAPPELKPGERVSIDFEYDPNGDPSGRVSTPFAVSVYSPERKQGWYLPWGHQGGGNLDESVVKDWYTHELRNRDIYGLNIKADLHATAQWGVDAESLGIRPHDVGFASALLNENRMSRSGYFGFSLESLAEAYLPEGERKVHPLGILPEDFGKVHSSLLAERGISDAVLTYRLHETLQPEIDDEGLSGVLELEDRCIYSVVGMERAGFRLDREKLERWSDEVPGHVAVLRKKIEDATGVVVNPRGRKSMTELFAKLGIDIPEMFDDKKQEWRGTFAAEQLKALEHPVIRDVLAMRKLESMQSKFLTKYLNAMDGDNRIHYQLHQLRADSEGEGKGTVSGRFSSGGGIHKLNVQQVAKGEKQAEEFEYLGLPPQYMVRELFLPNQGCVLGASDAAQIEFRMFGHYSRNEAVLQAYADDPRVDFHLLVTRLMNPGVHDEKILKKLRKHMKQNNFGVLYGMGRPKLAVRLGLGCTCGYDWQATDDDGFKARMFHRNSDHSDGCAAKEANAIMDRYHSEFPAAKSLLKRAAEVATTQGFVKTYLGRRRRFPTQYKIYSALNSVIQGSAADYFKLKLAMMWENRHRLGIEIHAPVHDEFVYSAPDLEAVRGVHRLLNEQSWEDFRVPLLWDTGYGNNWREANEG